MAAGKSRGVRGRRAASRRTTAMAVPLPHAPPSSGMHPCAAPCTQRRLGADTLWSRKPKACGPPTMALVPLTPPLPLECISAHSQADSGLRYWSWDSSKRLHQILRTPVPARRAAHAVPGSKWPQWGHLPSPFPKCQWAPRCHRFCTPSLLWGQWQPHSGPFPPPRTLTG